MPSFEACESPGNAREAMEGIAKLKPNLVLLDMAPPDKNGLELIKDIQPLHPGLPVLAMPMQMNRSMPGASYEPAGEVT